MNSLRNVVVPDIGDFANIPVIEVLVKRGDRVTRDTPLVVLESDKATLDVPSPEDGIVSEIKVALGTRVSVGSLLLTLDGVSTSFQGSTLGLVAPDPAIGSKVRASTDVSLLTTMGDIQRTVDAVKTLLPDKQRFTELRIAAHFAWLAVDSPYGARIRDRPIRRSRYRATGTHR